MIYSTKKWFIYFRSYTQMRPAYILKTLFYRADTDYWMCLCLKTHGCHAVLWCFTTIPAGGLGIAPLCLRYPATLKPISFIHFWILNYKTVCACRSSIMDVPLFPNQPKTFKFPQRSFGQKNPVKRSFQSSWFANITWLRYDEANDIEYCHVCMVAYRDGKLNSSNLHKIVC